MAEHRQVNTWISTAVYFALGRLARHQGSSKRAVLEQLLVEADGAATVGMTYLEFDAYLSGRVTV